MEISFAKAAEVMSKVTGIISKDVFKIGDASLLIITANAHYVVEYDLLEGDYMEQWFIKNTPCCGNRDHIGWCCDKNSCLPF